MLKSLFVKLSDLLRYPSTYQHLAVLGTLVGVNVAPNLQTLITTIGVSVFGAIGVFLSDVDVKPAVTDATSPK